MKIVECHSLQQVRAEIDRIDRQMVALLAERGRYVKQVARFKSNPAEVAAPERVQQIIANIAALAREYGADPTVAEATWRAMIAAFIQYEQAEHAALHPSST